MSALELPSSYFMVIVTFAVFFFSLNVFIIAELTSNPAASPLWLIGVAVGLIGLLYSYRMVRIHQKELIEAKKQRDAESATSLE